MAVLVIIQAWLGHPAGSVVRRQVTMVAAERWREQRVLLAAYTQCPDKQDPMLRVARYTWPISPAGTDPYGMWGIHVDAAEEQKIALQWLEQTAGSIDVDLPPQAKRGTDRVIASNRIRIATAEVLDQPKPSSADASSSVASTSSSSSLPASSSAAISRSAINAKTLPYGSGSMINLSVTNEAALSEEDTKRDDRIKRLASLFAAHTFDDNEAGVLLHLGRHGSIVAGEVAHLVATDAVEVWMNVLGRRLATLRINVMQRDDQGGPEPAWRWVG